MSPGFIKSFLNANGVNGDHRPDTGLEKLSDLSNQLLRSPQSLVGRTDGILNVTVCAMVTLEDPFIEEWIVYHRLL